MHLKEQLERFIKDSNLSEQEIKEIVELSEKILQHIEKKQFERKYYKLITEENKDKLLYSLKKGIPLKIGDFVVGEVVDWVRQFGEIYGKVEIHGIVETDDFHLVLNGDFVSGVVVAKESENV
jgi:hypothetical protein